MIRSAIASRSFLLRLGNIAQAASKASPMIRVASSSNAPSCACTNDKMLATASPPSQGGQFGSILLCLRCVNRQRDSQNRPLRFSNPATSLGNRPVPRPGCWPLYPENIGISSDRGHFSFQKGPPGKGWQCPKIYSLITTAPEKPGRGCAQ